MVRVLAATLLVAFASLAEAQSPGSLHVKVVLQDAEGKAVPVPHHALLISDNPATAAPRRVETAADGTVTVRLRAGNYTVESDAPVAFQGRAYHWMRTVDIRAGTDAVLELTAGDAEVEAVTADAANLTIDPIVNLTPWQDSIVALWTATTRASGFVIDAKGLIATNQQAIGAATSVEVQFGPAMKVAGRVLAADRTKDVAIVWVDPAAVASLRPVPTGCGGPAKPPLVFGQKIFALGAPMGEPKDVASGNVNKIEGRAIESDVVLGPGGAGGPVFSTDSTLAGITTDVEEEKRHRSSGITSLADLCDGVAAAEKKMTGAPPSGAQLPVEPTRPFPAAALSQAAKGPLVSLISYKMASTDFDVTFITPPLLATAEKRGLQGRGRDLNPLTEFGNWSDYVSVTPPVLLVRVTPRLVEGFWTTFARGAASTQGVALPPIKHFKSGFARMRALCGDQEVAPIHALTIEQRVSETDAIREGLYVFDPSALGPQCTAVTLVLYSEKEPAKADTRPVAPALIQRIAQDFAPFVSPQ